MDILESTTAKVEISELAGRYGHYADHHDWDALVALFAEDGVFDASDVYGRVWTGHTELHEFFDDAPDAVAHHPAGIFTELHDKNNATTVVKFLVFWRRQVTTVDYTWTLVKVDGSWRIANQKIAVLGRARWVEWSKEQ